MELAREWREGLLAAIASLAENPRRYAVIAEQARFRHETRQLLYRRTSGGPALRVLFSINEGGEMDAPTVSILHVRHGAQHPITRRKARMIEGQEI